MATPCTWMAWQSNRSVRVYDHVTAKDVDLSVQFKAISGRGDQGAGIIWRYRDDFSIASQ